MNEASELPRLTGDALLEWMVAGERRNRARRSGPDGQDLPPYPACTVCHTPVDSQDITLGMADVDDRVVTNKPCGHRVAFNLNAAKQKVARVQAIVDQEERQAAEPPEQDTDTEVASLRRQVAAARKYAAAMRDFCSPHGVSVHYADQLEAAMDRAKEEQA
jgi:hypothetical protein